MTETPTGPVAAAGDGLYVHEVITCRSLQGRERYQEIAKSMKGFTLLGTWQIVGMTGTWPTVLNIWQVPGGWAGWGDFLHRTYGAVKKEMHVYFDKFDEVRSGGSDLLMRPVPWSPEPEDLVAEAVTGSMFVHEVSTVRPGTGRDYLAAMNEHWRPVAADHGHRLIGMYEVLLSDTVVVTVWATSIERHIELMTSTDPRIAQWRSRAREFATGWHEELMAPAPGTMFWPDQTAPG
jgi:hypothetical protein